MHLTANKNCKLPVKKSNDIISSLYKINGSVVVETDKVRDLGVLLDSKWSFNDQIDAVLSKSLRSLGFIKRVSAYFSSIKTIIYLFKTLVLPSISFAAVIWSPYTSEKFEMLNGIVKKFLRYISYKSGSPMSYDDHNYSEISAKFGIHTVESLHKYYDLCFITDSIKSMLANPESSTFFKSREVNYDFRVFRPIIEETQRVDYTYEAPIHRMRRLWNKLSEEERGTFLNDSTRHQLRSRILQYF